MTTAMTRSSSFLLGLAAPRLCSLLLLLLHGWAVAPSAAQTPASPDILKGVYSTDVLSLNLPGLSISYFASDTQSDGAYGNSPQAIHDGNANCNPSSASWHSDQFTSGAHYVGLQFTNYVVRVDSYRATGRQGCYPQLAPSVYQLQGSNSSDPSSFVDLETPAAISVHPAMASWVSVAVGASRTYSYLRLYFPNPAMVNLAEIAIAGTLIYSPPQPESSKAVFSSDVLSLKLPGLSISYFASDVLSNGRFGHSPQAIHDGNANCRPDAASWHSEMTSPSGAHYVGVQFTNYVVRVDSYRATGRTGCYPQNAPSRYQLQGSNSSDPSSFVDLETPAAISGRPAMTDWVDVKVGATKTYSYLRFYFPYPGYVDLAEITIAGALIYSPPPVPCAGLGTAVCSALQAQFDQQTDALQSALATNANLLATATQLSGLTAYLTNAAVQLSNGAGMTVGMVAYFPYVCPAAWLRCNGAAVSRTAYAALFAAIGTQHGAGDGSTTFNVPELRGEFIRAVDDGRGVDAGRTLNSFQQATGVYNNYGGATVPDLGAGTVNIDGTATFNAVQGLQVGFKYNTGPRAYAYVRPRNVALHACIKA